jgi:hypothetical protein
MSCVLHWVGSMAPCFVQHGVFNSKQMQICWLATPTVMNVEQVKWLVARIVCKTKLQNDATEFVGDFIDECVG